MKIRIVAAAFVMVACWMGRARAQVPDAHGVCVTCSPDTSSSSSSSNSQPYQSDSGELRQIDQENAARAAQEAHDKAVRTTNGDGIAAFHAGNYPEAIRKFEAALVLDPNNTLLASNLSRARTEWANAIARETGPIHAAPKGLTTRAVPLEAQRKGQRGEPPPPSPGSSRFSDLIPEYRAPRGLVENAIASFRAVVPDAKDFTLHTLLDNAGRYARLGGAVSAYEALKDAKETSSKFKTFVTDTIKDISVSASQTAAVSASADGSPAEVHDATETSVARSKQFIDERGQAYARGKITDLITPHVGGAETPAP